MIKDLNEIYSGPDPKPKVPQPRPQAGPSTADEYLAWRKESGQNMQAAGSSFKAPEASPGDYEKFFGETGVYDPKLTGQDIGLTMGARQSFGNKLVRRLGTLVPNVAAGIVDMVGYTGALFTEWGDNRDYSNALNDAAEAIRKESQDVVGATYKRSNDTWALSDPTWWVDNIANTAEWAGSFALGGAGAGKLIGLAAKGIIGLGNLGLESSLLVQKAAQLGTSGLVSYAEAAQAGAQVYTEVYQNQLYKALADGASPEEAKAHATHIASQSAASASQLGTLLTMGINSSAFAPLFRSQTALSKEIIGKRLAQLEGQGAAEIASGIRGLSAADYMDKLMHHSGIRDILTEMTKEGGEEILQQFAQQTGTDVGNKGQTRGFLEQFGELERILDRTANSQGLLSFTLGAAFGGLQHGLLHNVIPSQKVDKLAPDGTPIQKTDGESVGLTDKNGAPVVEKAWVTPRKYERDFTQQSFNNVRDAIAADFEHRDNLETQYLDAIKKGDKFMAEGLRDEMFQPTMLHSIKQGLTEPWIKTFDGISKMEPEAAVQAGYAENVGDDSYKQRAQSTIEDIKHLSDVYGKLNAAYGTKYEGNSGVQPLVDMVFHRKADLYSTHKRIESFKSALQQQEVQESEMAEILDPQNFSKQVDQYVKQHNALKTVEKQLIQDHAALLKGDPKTIDRLLRKYRAVGMGDGKTAEAVKVLDQRLRDKQAQMVSKVEAAALNMTGSNEYLKWQEKNPGKGVGEYIKEASARHELSIQNKAMRARLEQAQAEYDIAEQHLGDMTAEKNATRFMKKVTAWQEGLIKQEEEAQRADTERLAEMAKDKAALNRLDRLEMDAISKRNAVARDEMMKRMRENLTTIESLKKNLLIKNPLKAIKARKEINRLRAENKVLGKRSQDYLLNALKYKVSTAPATEAATAEDVAGELDGKITVTGANGPTTATTNQSPIEPAMTIDDLFGQPVEYLEPLSIQDELAAMARDVEELATQNIDRGVDPLEQYNKAINLVAPEIKIKVEEIVEGLVDGSLAFSYDMLNFFVADKKIKQSTATQLLLAAREAAEEIKRLEAAEEFVPGEETPAVEEEISVKINGIDAPDTPVISNTDPEVAGHIPEPTAYHRGFKIVDAATTGATSTQDYEEGTRMIKGEKAFVKVTKPDGLLRPASEAILKPGKLAPGHNLVYEVDVDYDGPKLITDSLSWDGDGAVVQSTERGADYLDSNGKVKADPRMVGNVPIKVMDGQTGKFLFHIRKLDWLHAKYPGTKDYRNVVDTIETKEGHVIDNLAIQTETLMEIRQHIVERFNKEGKPTNGKIASPGKGTGRLILNHVISEKNPETLEIKSKVEHGFAFNKRNPDKSMLPDKSLQLVIVGDEGDLQSGYNYSFPGATGFDSRELVKGGIGAMVPSANGQFLYAPLIGMKLVEPGKPSPALNSVVRAIELYLLNDGSDPQIGSEMSGLESNTGFDLSTAQGLRGFINQFYTYLQGFQDAALSPNSAAEVKAEQFLFNVDSLTRSADKTKLIKAGFTMRGDGVRYANLVDGKLDPAFVEILAQGFATRSRAVVFTNPQLGIRGINSSGTFVDAIYSPAKGWQHNNYDSYNEYVKSFSRTPVYGRNKLGDGTYVYTVNPNLPISVEGLRQEAVLVEPNDSAETIDSTEIPEFESDASLFDELANNSIYRSPTTVKAFATGSDNSSPLDYKTLEEIYNFTPEVERNGKTILEVLDELAAEGHSYISKGYNPFSRCL